MITKEERPLRCPSAFWDTVTSTTVFGVLSHLPFDTFLVRFIALVSQLFPPSPSPSSSPPSSSPPSPPPSSSSCSSLQLLHLQISHSQLFGSTSRHELISPPIIQSRCHSDSPHRTTFDSVCNWYQSSRTECVSSRSRLMRSGSSPSADQTYLQINYEEW